MALRTVRRLTAALIPLISMGLLITSLALDEWYSSSYIDGDKEDEGSLWTEHRLDYGIYSFEYTRSWSDILGENYRQEKAETGGGFGNLLDYSATSMALIILIHIPLVVLGFLCAIGRVRNVLPILLSLLIGLGLVLVSGNLLINMEDEADYHVEEGLPPLDENMGPNTIEGLRSSGRRGPSATLLFLSCIFPFISLVLLVDPRKDRDPSRDQLQRKFFK